MANKNGSTYGLTILSPIKGGHDRNECPVDILRDYLRALPKGSKSPFCRVQSTHLARFSIIDDVFYEGTSAREDHLKSNYLWLNSNFDGELDDYLESMFDNMSDEIEAIWQNCVAFPGIAAGKEKWKQYMVKCQIETTFFFAAVNDMTVDEMLRSLMLKQEFSKFAAEHQGVKAQDLQRDFLTFVEKFESEPTPPRGSIFYQFKKGGE